MSQCPKCQSEIPESAFGLYTCTSCSSVLNVDMEGRSYFAEDMSPQSVDQNFSGSVEVSESDQEVSLIKEIQQNYSQMSPEEDMSGRTVAIDPYTLPDRQADLSSTSFEDVVKYAQSESSNAASGAFYYDVLLEGIDSEDLRVSVREALRDVRFGWKVEDQMGKVRRGTLLLEKLNPVKASIVISRLKSLPLKIKWSQNGILESDS